MNRHERLLYLTVGVLIGVVVMQWRMPNGRAAIVLGSATPTGILSLAGEDAVLAVDGSVWTHSDFSGWSQVTQVPVPPIQVVYIDRDRSGFTLLTQASDMWTLEAEGWVNRGSPPVGPVSTEERSWGSIKDGYKGNE